MTQHFNVKHNKLPLKVAAMLHNIVLLQKTRHLPSESPSQCVALLLLTASLTASNNGSARQKRLPTCLALICAHMFSMGFRSDGSQEQTPHRQNTAVNPWLCCSPVCRIVSVLKDGLLFLLPLQNVFKAWKQPYFCNFFQFPFTLIAFSHQCH